MEVEKESGTVSEVRWVPNTDMLADPLTKRGANCLKLSMVLESGRMGVF